MMLQEIEKIYFPSFYTACKGGCFDFELNFRQEGEFSNA